MSVHLLKFGISCACVGFAVGYLACRALGAL